MWLNCFLYIGIYVSVNWISMVFRAVVGPNLYRLLDNKQPTPFVSLLYRNPACSVILWIIWHIQSFVTFSPNGFVCTWACCYWIGRDCWVVSTSHLTSILDCEVKMSHGNVCQTNNRFDWCETFEAHPDQNTGAGWGHSLAIGWEKRLQAI